MSAFDDLTLAEVETLSATVLGGKGVSDAAADPLMLAGGIMWLTARRVDPSIVWDEFKAVTKMGDIKSFSIQMEADDLNPTNAR